MRCARELTQQPAAYGSLTLDQLDDAFFPRHGYYITGTINRESGPYGTTTASLLVTTPFPRGSFVIQPRLAINSGG
jgi:hypothetical protein